MNIIVYKFKKTRSLYLQDRFIVTPTGRIQKALWNYLRKKKAARPASTPVETEKVITINERDVVKRLNKDYLAYCTAYEHPPRKIYMGFPQEDELRHASAEKIIIRLSMKAGNGLQVTYRDIEVDVIPHFDGVLMV